MPVWGCGMVVGLVRVLVVMVLSVAKVAAVMCPVRLLS